MEKVTPGATPRPDTSIRRKLAELKERHGWVHHVANAETGKLLTTPLDRPLGPLSRAKRLSHLGHQFDPSVFGTPTHRLTTRRPWQTSPLGFVRFRWARETDPLGDPEPDGYVAWDISEDIISKLGSSAAMEAWLFDVPRGRCLSTLQLLTSNEPGQVLSIQIGLTAEGLSRVIRLAEHRDGWLFQTVDIVFTASPVPHSLHAVTMSFEPGSGHQIVEFLSLTLAPQRPGEIGL
jgi:hypothetical protein